MFRLEHFVISLGEVAQQTIAMMRPAADEKRIGLEVGLDQSCQLGLTDPDRVLEGMINLVESAIEFTPPEGAIMLQACVVDADPSSVYVSASETGRGVNSETKARSSNDPTRIAKPSITTAQDWDWWAGACLAIFSLEMPPCISYSKPASRKRCVPA
jgi:K+-sensing histidine kinase KdpD